MSRRRQRIPRSTPHKQRRRKTKTSTPLTQSIRHAGFGKRTQRQLAAHKGALQQMTGSWKGIPLHLKSPPKTGSGMLGKQTVLTGIGPQTQRRRGTAPSVQIR